MTAPCGICRGRLGPIHYDEPSDAQHPLSFVVDEIKPISKWKQFGYDSAAHAAQDWNNLQAAHWICNARKGARVGYDPFKKIKPTIKDGEWSSSVLMWAGYICLASVSSFVKWG